MRKVIRIKAMQKLAGAALAVSTAAGAAAAAGPPSSHEVVGRIERLNPRGHHLTVKSETYRYDPRLTGAGLHRGDHVRILYRERHGHRYAIQILPAV